MGIRTLPSIVDCVISPCEMVTSNYRILRHKQFEEYRLREFEEALNREAVS